MTRRMIGFFVTLALGFFMGPLASTAQPPGHIPVVGVLEPGPNSTPPRACLQGFTQGLNDLGYREGHNLRLEYRYADFQPDRLQALAAELARLQPQVIFTHS